MKQKEFDMEQKKFDDYLHMRTQVEEFEQGMIGNLREIVSTICISCFIVAGPHRVWWENAGDGEIGHPRIIETGKMPYHFEAETGSKPELVTSTWGDYAKNIPIEYLFMDIDKVILDVNGQIEYDLELKKARTDKLDKLAYNEVKLIASAKGKLNEQELKVLGL